MTTVVPVITFSAENGIYVVNETFPVTFTCTATGIPPPTNQWLRDDFLLDPSINDTRSSRYQLADAIVNRTEGAMSIVMRMLTINSAMDSDNGTYMCRANNSAVNGEDQDIFELYVQGIITFRFLTHIVIIIFYCLVPPTIIRGNNRSQFIANEGDSETFTFVISRADPLVMIDDIRWFYSRNFSVSPFNRSNDITNLPNRIQQSAYTFSTDLLRLTISNIVQARVVGEETDAGRYFLVATNPAGVSYSYYDLVVGG